MYFFVMNDYGFRPSILFKLDSEKGYFPNPNDVYDPAKRFNGNTNPNAGNPDYLEKLDWQKTSLGQVDLRLFYFTKAASFWNKCRWT